MSLVHYTKDCCATTFTADTLAAAEAMHDRYHTTQEAARTRLGDSGQDEKVFATISAGNVEYDMDAAGVDIDELINALQEAKEDGATHLVGLSGNYRGASYVRLGVNVSFEGEW